MVNIQLETVMQHLELLFGFLQMPNVLSWFQFRNRNISVLVWIAGFYYSAHMHKFRPVMFNSNLSTFCGVTVPAIVYALLYYFFLICTLPPCTSPWWTACEVLQGTVPFTRMPRKDAPTCLMCIWIALYAWIKFEVVSVVLSSRCHRMLLSAGPVKLPHFVSILHE